jgi:hypothetical protein
VLVLGRPPLSLALSRGLEAVGCTATSAAVHGRELADLERYRRVVYLADAGDPVVSVVSFVHYVRTELTWTGGLVAVVPTPNDKRLLDEAPLAEGVTGLARFGRTPGHASATRNCLVAGVARELVRVSSLPHGSWLRIQDGSRTSVLLSKLHALEATRVAAEPADICTAVADVIATFSSIDWRPLLVDPHRDLVHVERVHALAARSLSGANPDVLAVLMAIRQCLSRSWLKERL